MEGSSETHRASGGARVGTVQDKAQLVLGSCVKELTVRLSAATAALRGLSDSELAEERGRELEWAESGKPPFHPVYPCSMMSQVMMHNFCGAIIGHTTPAGTHVLIGDLYNTVMLVVGAQPGCM